MARAFLVALGVALGVVSQAPAGTIDTTTAWNGGSYIYAFGPNSDSSATYGQTFTASASLGLQLNSFSFLLQQDSNYSNGPNPSHFSAYVMAWNSGLTEATGPVLYTSPKAVLSLNPNSFTEYTFSTGGIDLTEGLQYIIFLSVSNYYDGNTADDMAADFGNNPYPGGQFFFLGNANNSSEWTSTPWGGFGATTSAAFIANFSETAAPEPASLALLGIGIAGLAGYGIRRPASSRRVIWILARRGSRKKP